MAGANEATGGALQGVKVLDLSRLLPGPYCSMILADHGADVLAIEDSRFQADNLFFHEIYRNKRHMSLNLKSEEGLRIFHHLAGEADIVLEGFRPGVTSRLGVDYQTLAALNPRLIYCSITGYGQDGPKRDAAGHDVNYLSVAGILDLIGPQGESPTIPAVQVADILGGAMQAAVGILLALQARERTGQGQYIDIAMTDGVLGLLTLPLFFQRTRGEQPARSSATLSHRYGCYNTYRTADERYVAIGAVESRFWRRLCELLGCPQYAKRQYDEECREEIIDQLRRIFAAKPLAWWRELLEEEDVCFSPVARLDEVLSSPLFRERQMVGDARGVDAGATLGIPVKLSGTPGTLRTPPAAFGADTDQVLRELGYDEQQIADLRAQKVV